MVHVLIATFFVVSSVFVERLLCLCVCACACVLSAVTDQLTAFRWHSGEKGATRVRVGFRTRPTVRYAS